MASIAPLPEYITIDSPKSFCEILEVQIRTDGAELKIGLNLDGSWYISNLDAVREFLKKPPVKGFTMETLVAAAVVHQADAGTLVQGPPVCSRSD
jgi:hypothetical protein